VVVDLHSAGAGLYCGLSNGATRFAGHKGLLGVLDLHWAEA